MDTLHFGIFLVVALLLAIVSVIADRVYRTRSEAMKLSLPVPGGSVATEVVTVRKVVPVRVVINPLKGISFEDSLQPEVFAEATRDNVIGAMLASYGADTATTMLEIAASHTGSLLVSFKDQNYELVRSTSGVYKAITRAANGDFHEIANVDKFGTWLNNFSHASAAVVAVSHLISNADMSKRLGQVQQNTEKLLEYRQIDSMAEIKTAYEALREEMGRAEPRQNAIARHRDTIRMNRHRLFGEAQTEVNKMNSMLRSNHATVRKMVHMLKARSFNQRKQELADVMVKLQKASYCLQLEALAAPFCASERDQMVLRNEAATTWGKLASEMMPLEDELREHDQCATQLLAIAKIMRSKT